MKNSTIQLLHQGKRRPIDKQQYTKLRTYNKIKTSRVRDLEASNMQSTYRIHEHYQYSAQKLIEVIECLRKDVKILVKENQHMDKIVGINSKIEKMLNKRFPSLNENDGSAEEREDRINAIIGNEKNLQAIYEFKLSLDVIQLQSSLAESNEKYKSLLSNKKKNHQQKVTDMYFKEKIAFLNIICSKEHKTQRIQQNLATRKELIDEIRRSMQARLKKNEKLNLKEMKNLEALNFQFKELEQAERQRKKRLRKDSCEFIEIENGQVRNQQDIKKELRQIQAKTLAEGQELQQYLQHQMLQKISLINEIEKYEQICRRIPLDQKPKTTRESIQVI